MPTKNTKPKSRTANSTALSKKVHVPIWAIVVVIAVIAGAGLFLIYKSFASGQRNYVSGYDITCSTGFCYSNPVIGNQYGKICYPRNDQYRYSCYSGSSKPRL